jgi:2-oxoglutarate ferredoxin oxidoreductase subunit alpha
MKKYKNIKLIEHIIEIVADAGEGVQKAGTSFAHVSAKIGNSLWTVEIIPAEIQPPPHTTGSASGMRIRISSEKVTNAGDLANLVVAFNEMSLLSRIEAGTIRKDAIVLIDGKWGKNPDPAERKNYYKILNNMKAEGATIYEIPIEEETSKILDDPLRGKNMFALGVIAFLYKRDIEILRGVIEKTFKLKSSTIRENNRKLLDNGYKYAEENFDFQFDIDSHPVKDAMMAINGNQAIALGAIAAGYEMCSMYPITPATSVTHYLSEIFEKFGGFIHQAEDEIAAIGTAIGASYAGKPTLTVTSGPGLALKTEFMGLAVMAEVPMVVVDVQRGGPSTGLPTKIEQSDLLSALHGTPGDAPKIIMAPSTIEECFHIMQTAKKLSEQFRILVIVLTDANLATGVQLFKRPKLNVDNFQYKIDKTPVEESSIPYDWDEQTGLSRRLIPGQPGGMSMASSLNHSPEGMVGYDPASNKRGHKMRARKLAVFQKTLKTPTVYGEKEGDLLIVGWGSTRGAIEETVDRLKKEGYSVSSLNIKFLSPLPSGLKEIFLKFKKVMTVEINYSDDINDPFISPENRRYSQLAYVLRAHTLLDIDCYSEVLARPFMPMEIYNGVKPHLDKLLGKEPSKSEANGQNIKEKKEDEIYGITAS